MAQIRSQIKIPQIRRSEARLHDTRNGAEKSFWRILRLRSGQNVRSISRGTLGNAALMRPTNGRILYVSEHTHWLPALRADRLDPSQLTCAICRGSQTNPTRKRGSGSSETHVVSQQATKRQGFSHREADGKTHLDEVLRRGMGGAAHSSRPWWPGESVGWGSAGR
jgi:hypothetical protein